ncbi:hypothetical protein BH10BAC1_BH10BAC1_00800 [soil metagenome]
MKKPVVILLHIIYWILYLAIIITIIKLINEAHTVSRIWFNIFFSSCLIPGLLGFYFSYGFLFPRFLKRKKILGFFLAGITVYMGCAFIQEIYLTLTPGPGIFEEQWDSAIGITVVLTIIAFINGIMGLVLRGFISWYADIKLKEELNKKNYEMELELIKSQINPHFLFNTINNIDVLIAKDATKASIYLNKLSDIMRFMLYETKTEQIELTKELTYIEKYIDLQKIRTSNSEYINYTLNGDAKNLSIAPMLFIPFIENAFKHSENKKIENAIRIQIDIQKDKIIFECENHYSKESQTKLDKNGLGNDLIQKRLELLYAKKHLLEITNQNNIYKVKLTLL